MERNYLDSHPDSGYFTDILGLDEFPDYIDYLPKGAIVRKVKVMAYMPQKEVGRYPYTAISEDEYNSFIINATKAVTDAIEKYKRK